MRHLAVPLLLCVFLGSTDSHAQTSSQQRLRKIPLNLQEVNINDALIELGRAGGANFMADATQLPVQSPPITAQWVGSMDQNLTSLSAKQKLTWLNKKRILLLWSEPDINQLAKRILLGSTIKLITPRPEGANVKTLERVTETPTPNELDVEAGDELLLREASDYFREKHDWNINTPGAISEVLISELPPKLRAKIVDRVQTTAIPPQSPIIWKAWLSDAFWEKARLETFWRGARQKGSQRTLLLAVGGQVKLGNGYGHSQMSLGALEKEPNK